MGDGEEMVVKINTLEAEDRNSFEKKKRKKKRDENSSEVATMSIDANENGVAVGDKQLEEGIMGNAESLRKVKKKEKKMLKQLQSQDTTSKKDEAQPEPEAEDRNSVDENVKKKKSKKKDVDGSQVKAARDEKSGNEGDLGGQNGDKLKRKSKPTKNIITTEKRRKKDEALSEEEDGNLGENMMKKNKKKDAADGNQVTATSDDRSGNEGDLECQNGDKLKRKSKSTKNITAEKRRKKGAALPEAEDGNSAENIMKKNKKMDAGDGSQVTAMRDDDISANESDLEFQNGAKLKRKSKSTKSNTAEKRRKKDECSTADAGTKDSSEENTPKKSSKKVRFAEEVEVSEDSLVRGKRFSPEEDEMVRKAVFDYISAHDLGDRGLDMILHCKDHPEVKNCWKEIGLAIPYRPYISVYYRAHILFERGDEQRWTEEEREIVSNFYAKHGADWKTLAEMLGKQRLHVKDFWRRICLPNKKNGKWGQDEYQQLYDYVNLDLQMKALQEKRSSKHGMLRDDIAWTAISRKLQTRSQDICCLKWYGQLASPMVVEGKWRDVDDYRLLKALYELDACCMEDVDWNNLIEYRSGDVCRQRWTQMVKHLGEHRTKPFPDQLEVLTQRYCPDLLEAREAFDNLPVED